MIPASVPMQRRLDARLLVIESGAITHRARAEFPTLVRAGDVVVANDAATLPARLPVDAQPNTGKPSSTQRVAATETTRSL